MKKHCCEMMKGNLEHSCDLHEEPYDCPDTLIDYVETFDEYGIIIHDGGHSKITIQYCPWCGKKLPTSKRDRWFLDLEKLGYDEPFEQDIPKKYQTDEWYRKKND